MRLREDIIHESENALDSGWRDFRLGGNPIDMRIKRPPEKILELNAWIKKYAAEKKYVYLDYFPATVDDRGLLRKELSEDGLHPNAKGYAAMAPLAEEAIRSALKQRP